MNQLPPDTDYDGGISDSSDSMEDGSSLEGSTDQQLSALKPVCRDSVCLQPRCKAARVSQVKLIVWLPFWPSQPYLQYGTLERGQFFFSQDSHLSHLVDLPSSIYMLYRARHRPHWGLANVNEGEHVAEGEFLIYRSSEFLDDDCHGLDPYIRELHASMNASHPNNPVWPVPRRYQEAPQSAGQKISEEADSDSSGAMTSSESDDGFNAATLLWRDAEGSVRGMFMSAES